MKWIAPILLALLAGCSFIPPQSPLPTPTTLSATLLPVEGILREEPCREVPAEFELFFLASEEELNDTLSEIVADPSASDYYLSLIEGQTDFQTHRLLLAHRTCHTSAFNGITIDRVVSVADRLYVYVELIDPGRGSYRDHMGGGDFHLVKIPWPPGSPDQPVLEAIPYQVLTIVGAPVP